MESALDAKGVAVTIDSTHQCMTMRGIKKEQCHNSYKLFT